MPAPARARDSDAPPGAPDTWLPDEAWVGEHWIPYDERDLYRVLEIDQAGLVGWLRVSATTSRDWPVRAA
jgi:hypothetical protein